MKMKWKIQKENNLILCINRFIILKLENILLIEILFKNLYLYIYNIISL